MAANYSYLLFVKIQCGLIYLLVFFPCLVSSQDLSGFWKGTLSMTGGCFPVNNIELQLYGKGNVVEGNSYHYLDINYYVKKKFIGRFDRSSKKLSLQEGMVTTFKIPSHCNICIKYYDLEYSLKGNVEMLTGNWGGKVQHSGADCTTGPITLTRVKESAFKEIPEIAVDTGTIRLDFYDNGMVDGDSISVLVNKQVVISNEKLTARPVTSYITVDLQHTFHELEMRAENSGTIPPNTALLVITAGRKTFRLFLTSTEKKSATVRFLYDP